jgi:hypothetical protein
LENAGGRESKRKRGAATAVERIPNCGPTMTRITLFSSTVGDGPARLTVSVTQNFDSADAFIIALGNDNWPLSTQDAARLAGAGKRIEGVFDYSAQHGEPVTEEPYFRRQLGSTDGRALTFEIGIDASGPLAAVYIEWRGRRIVDGRGRLLKALAVLGEAAATIRQTKASRRTQDIRIDPQTFRSPYGWDGRAPWET